VELVLEFEAGGGDDGGVDGRERREGEEAHDEAADEVLVAVGGFEPSQDIVHNMLCLEKVSYLNDFAAICVPLQEKDDYKIP